MARPLWSGTITFAMVNIPVKMFSAVSPKDVHFHQLTKSGARVRQKRVDESSGKEVPYDEITKGYEVSPDRYVLVDKKELDALDPKENHTIEISSFAERDEIDPLYFENAYYLAPGPGAEKSYALFLRALQESDKVAIGRTVMRGKQYTVALRASGRAMTMNTLYYSDEIVPAENVDGLPKSLDADAKHLALAKELIENLSEKFDATKYHDEYREKLLELIQQKAAGEAVSVQPVMKESSPRVINLMEALKASLDETRKKSGSATAEKPKKSAPAKKSPAHRTRKKESA